MLELKDRERIIIFTGPDGSGRNSIALAVGQTFGMEKVISYVTRPPRPGEIDGHDYHFISNETYLKMEQQGEFLENVEFEGNRYGVRSSDVEESFSHNSCVYLVLNRHGSEQIKKLYGDKAIRVFLFADPRILEERYRVKGLDEPFIAKRLSIYDSEMAYRSSCEYAFESIDMADTVSRVTELLEDIFQRGLVDKD